MIIEDAVLWLVTRTGGRSLENEVAPWIIESSFAHLGCRAWVLVHVPSEAVLKKLTIICQIMWKQKIQSLASEASSEKTSVPAE
jgi:hypothetical protein